MGSIVREMYLDLPASNDPDKDLPCRFYHPGFASTCDSCCLVT